MHVGSCCYVPSCQAPEVAASQGLEWAMLIHLREAPVHAWPGARVDERGGRGRRVAKSCLPVLIVGWRSDGRRSFPGLVLFRLTVVEPFSGTRCMIPQSFVSIRNRSYQEFWVITGSPRYPGYLPRQIQVLHPYSWEKIRAPLWVSYLIKQEHFTLSLDDLDCVCYSWGFNTLDG
jgi:hypothetical protein